MGNGGQGVEHYGSGNGGEYGNQANHVNAWVKTKILVRWNSTSTGLLYVTVNNSEIINDTEYTDAYPNTNRSEAIGGYAGNYDANNWRYFADVYYDRGPNDGALYLTNNATFASSTITAIQHWTSWSSSSITAVCNLEALSSGTVHVHFKSIEQGDIYLGTLVAN